MVFCSINRPLKIVVSCCYLRNIILTLRDFFFNIKANTANFLWVKPK